MQFLVCVCVCACACVCACVCSNVLQLPSVGSQHLSRLAKADGFFESPPRMARVAKSYIYTVYIHGSLVFSKEIHLTYIHGVYTRCF